MNEFAPSGASEKEMTAMPVLATDKATDGLAEDELSFWEHAFLAMAASAIESQGWKLGDEPITSGDSRMRLCAIWADRAVTERRARLDSI